MMKMRYIFFDRNAKPIGMIPSSQLVDKWIDNPIICEDTWKAKPMPEHSISKILNAEFACISSGGSRFFLVSNLCGY